MIKKKKNIKGTKKTKISSLWLSLLGVFLLGASAFLIFSINLFTPSVENVLPKGEVMYFVKINDLPCSKGLQEKAPQACNQRNLLFKNFFQDFPERISLFSDQTVYLGYANPLNIENDIETARLYRISNTKKATEFLEKSAGESVIKEDLHGYSLYSIAEPQSEYAMIFRGWLIFSPKKTFFEKLVQVKSENMLSLAQDETFMNIQDETPYGETYGYFETEYLQESIAPKYQLLADYFPRFSFSLTEYSEEITLHTLGHTKTGNIIPQKEFTEYLHHLVAALPEQNLAGIFGTQDATTDFEKSLDFFEKTDPAFSFLLQGRLRQELYEIFDVNIDLENDIFPLLRQESLVAFYTGKDQNLEFLIALKSGDENFTSQKRKKFITSLENAASRFIPQILVHTLDDGTTISEVTTCDDCVSKEEKNIGEATYTIFTVESEEEKKELVFGEWEDYLVVSSSAEHNINFLKNIQSSVKNPSTLFGGSLPDSSEILMIQPKNLSTLYSEIPFLSLSEFKSVVASRQSGEKFLQIDLKMYFDK